MATKKSYQEWCIDTLCYILNNRKDYLGSNADQGYIYSIKAIINHYSSMYYCEKHFCKNSTKQYLNLWWDHINKNNMSFAFNELLMTKSAQEILKKCIENNYDPKALKKELHFEHATPVAFTYNQLINLMSQNNISKTDVENCFRSSKIVLITKEESKKLDGKNCVYKNGEFAGQRLKDTGWGDLRMEYLSNQVINGKKIEFVDIDGNPMDYKKYFKNKKYSIK